MTVSSVRLDSRDSEVSEKLMLQAILNFAMFNRNCNIFICKQFLIHNLHHTTHAINLCVDWYTNNIILLIFGRTYLLKSSDVR
jgi:hypothetical protein